MKGLGRKIILVSLILVSFVLFAPASASSAEPVKFDIYLAGATPAGGGIWDMMGAGFAEAIMRSNEGSLVTVMPGGGVPDVTMVSKGQAELGLTHSILAAASREGKDPFEQKYDNIRTFSFLYTSEYHFCVNPDAGIESIAAIKERKIPVRLAVGDPGSSGQIGIERILQAYGVSFEDIESWGGKIYYKDFSEANVMFGDGVINAFMQSGCAPMAPLRELALTKKVQILPISEEVIQIMVNEFGYSPAVIHKEAYDFMTEDIKAISAECILITSEEVPEEVIYNVTRGMIENLDYIRSIHSRLQILTPEGIAEKLLSIANSTGVSLHPGAEKYYKEIGLID